MRNENRFYDLCPQIIPTGRQTTVTIKPLFGHCMFHDGQEYCVVIRPAEGCTGQTAWDEPGKMPVVPQDGLISFAHTFGGEQEYSLLVYHGTGEGAGLIADLRLYALDADLYACRPYKGDMHMHTFYSDGKESPAYLTGACRRAGFDFVAVTDHRQYAPSLEAIDAYKDADIDLRIYPGEEVHPPDNPVHIVNFGGRFSINELFGTDTYRSEIRAIEERLTGLPAGADAYPYASCLWCFEKIREAGGLGIFCHPYWFAWHRYDVPGYLTDLVFEHQPYDALELISGYHRYEAESNILQVARYHEERAMGRKIPVVGVSDSHGCENADLFGWYYTIVFAKSPDLTDLIEGIKSMKSIAVEAMPGETPRVHGPFRLVRYGQYLMREVFPRHDELCVEEGRLMLAHVAGDREAARHLSTLKDRTTELYDHIRGTR